MKYTLEEIYLQVGREDKVAGVTLRAGSASFEKYGEFITVVFLYTQQEREQLDKSVVDPPNNHSGYVKAKILALHDLDASQIEALKSQGIHSDDILWIDYFKGKENNTFHSNEKRSMHKIEVQSVMQPKGGDLGWMYGFKKDLIEKGIGLMPREKHFYLACRYWFENDKLTDGEMNEIFPVASTMAEHIEFEVLYIKYQVEKISESEKKRLSVLLDKKKLYYYNILDKYLKEQGSSLQKLRANNEPQAVKLFTKTLHFLERKLNVTGKIPIYVDLDGYLHIYLRHVEEMKFNANFEHKDNFQWNEDDVFSVMGHVIRAYDNEIQKYFSERPNMRYSKYGPQSAYFEGDYYTFHIEPSGRIDTFHKNKKEHEKKTS